MLDFSQYFGDYNPIPIDIGGNTFYALDIEYISRVVIFCIILKFCCQILLNILKMVGGK